MFPQPILKENHQQGKHIVKTAASTAVLCLVALSSTPALAVDELRILAPTWLGFAPVRHMALGVDAILPTAICERAARAVGGLVAPPLTYGVQSQPRTGGGHGFDGTTILRMDHWELVRPATIDRIFPDGYPGIELEHASVLETSYMLALRPDLVDLSQALNDGPASFGPYDRFPRPNDGLPPSGVLSLTEGSTAEKGEWLLADCQARLLEIMAHEFGLSL